MTTPFLSPFDAGAPHPRARAAAEALQSELSRRPELSRPLFQPGAGKMFGVLVAHDASGSEVELRAFSGLLNGAFLVDGFVPPLFDAQARAQVEGPGTDTVARLTARHLALAGSPALAAAREAVATLTARHRAAQETLAAEHRAAKHDRDARRRAGAPEAPLAQESRGHKAQQRWLEATQAEERTAPQRTLARLERRLAASERLRAWSSRRLMRAIFDSYRVTNALGEVASLGSLFQPAVSPEPRAPSQAPPSGAGDCAAPKLLAAAYRQQLTPVAMAEFFWGSPPASSPRRSGEFAPACRLKCGPLLPFMLRGLEVAPPRGLGAAAATTDLKVLYEDAWVLAVEKPAGLLSVPGRSAALQDSVQTRLRVHHASATLVHRLDLDTSGVLVAAKDAEAYRALQHQFAARTVEKRYLAVVEGQVARPEGEIDLALRVDLNDRPRQLHDPVHGRRAVTTFRVLERAAGRTRLELSPRTGRTHQLRVHSALGLGAPIVGDRLYGQRGERLMLHASSICFLHPHTQQPLRIESPAPF